MTNKSFEEKVDEMCLVYDIERTHAYGSASAAVDIAVARRNLKTALLALVREEVERVESPPSRIGKDYLEGFYHCKQSIAEHFGGSNE